MRSHHHLPLTAIPPLRLHYITSTYLSTETSVRRFARSQASRDAFEARVVQVQRFARRHRGGGAAEVAGRVGKPSAIRCLKSWIPNACSRWTRRRREGGVIIYDFLKDARLSQNLKAIYNFRRKVMW